MLIKKNIFLIVLIMIVNLFGYSFVYSLNSSNNDFIIMVNKLDKLYNYMLLSGYKKDCEGYKKIGDILKKMYENSKTSKELYNYKDYYFLHSICVDLKSNGLKSDTIKKVNNILKKHEDISYKPGFYILLYKLLYSYSSIVPKIYSIDKFLMSSDIKDEYIMLAGYREPFKYHLYKVLLNYLWLTGNCKSFFKLLYQIKSNYNFYYKDKLLFQYSFDNFFFKLRKMPLKCLKNIDTYSKYAFKIYGKSCGGFLLEYTLLWNWIKGNIRLSGDAIKKHYNLVLNYYQECQNIKEIEYKYNYSFEKKFFGDLIFKMDSLGYIKIKKNNNSITGSNGVLKKVKDGSYGNASINNNKRYWIVIIIMLITLFFFIVIWLLKKKL